MFGVRIITSQVDDCYRTLGVVHNLYKPVAGRFKDYVAIPKANGYQSLHTTLIGMRGVTMEVQIRTREMDAVADHGIAGHWLYKSGDASLKHQARASRWVNGVLDLQRRAGDPQEFIESLKTDLFPDEVYVFSPKGDIFELPRGACPVDFAYAVHTDIGNHCVAVSRGPGTGTPVAATRQRPDGRHRDFPRRAAESGVAHFCRVGTRPFGDPPGPEGPAPVRVHSAGATASQPLAGERERIHQGLRLPAT